MPRQTSALVVWNVWTQPVAGTHVSVVQTLLSLQLVGPPGWQLPPLQTSPVVQALKSLQGLVLLVWKQPLTALQASSVQTLLSSQLSGVPGLQVPPPRTSWPLRTGVASRGLVMLVCPQPVTASQASVVHTLLSSQLSGVPGLQVPPPHTSWPLQTVLSSHGFVLFVCPQPVTASQASVVHTLPSSQLSGVPGLQVPPPHTSWPLQTVLSSHGFVLFVCPQPVTASQASVVHTLPSSQLSGVPGL